jgi:hypothetical protein
MPAHRLHFNDKAESTQDHEVSKIPFSPIFEEDAELIYRDASDATIRAVIAILPYMRKATPPGHLTMSTAELSKRVLLPQKQIGDCLRELTEMQIFARDKQTKIYSYPKMAALLRRKKGLVNDQKPSETFANDYSVQRNIQEGDSPNEASQYNRDKISLNASPASHLNLASLSNTNIAEREQGSPTATPGNHCLSGFDIDSKLSSTPGIKATSKDVNRYWLASLKTQARWQPIASQFDQIVSNSIDDFVRKNPDGELKCGWIIGALNYALSDGKRSTRARQADSAEVKAPAPPEPTPKPRRRI